MEIDEIISIQNNQLVMLSTVHLKDDAEPEDVLLTFTNLPHDAVQISKHTAIEPF